MKLKGLAKAISQAEALQAILQTKIDDLYDEPPQWEEKDEFYNHVWDDLQEALDALVRVQDINLDDYL